MAKHPAIFLDRDGTIIEDKGYINKPVDVAFLPQSFKALEILQEHFLIFIITNQSGISKGIITENEVKEVNNHIVEKLKEKGIAVFDVFCCPHKTEDHCECKKPNPHFVFKAAQLYNLDLTKSYIIGDHPSDAQCGINAGITPIHVLTGHGEKHKNELASDTKICKNIYHASKTILGS